MKAYIIGSGDGPYHLITADGHNWYGHWCSNESFAIRDLYNNRPERIEELNHEYGDVEVLYLGQDEMTQEELLRRNHEWWDSLPEEDKK